MDARADLFVPDRKHTGTQAEYPAPYPDRIPHQKMFKSGVGGSVFFVLFCFITLQFLQDIFRVYI